MLTDVEREHLFLLGLGRPPDVRYQTSEGVTPRLQRVLDALEFSPAVVSTVTWDIVAWNRAAAAVLTDYSALAPEQRNVLRLIFCDPRVRAAQLDWEAVARFVVGAFRADAARAGAAAEVAAAGGRTLPAQSRIRGDVARQRRPRLWRRRQTSAASDRRTDRFRILGLRGRRPARSPHGGLQSRDCGGCGADQIAHQAADPENCWLERGRKRQPPAKLPECALARTPKGRPSGKSVSPASAKRSAARR